MKEGKSGGEMKGWMDKRGKKNTDRNMKDLQGREERRKMKLGWEGGRLREEKVDRRKGDEKKCGKEGRIGDRKEGWLKNQEKEWCKGKVRRWRGRVDG